MTTYLGKSCSFGLPRVPFVNCRVFSYFPFGFEGRMWDMIVSVPDHCLSFLLWTKRLRIVYLVIDWRSRQGNWGNAHCQSEFFRRWKTVNLNDGNGGSLVQYVTLQMNVILPWPKPGSPWGRSKGKNQLDIERTKSKR